MKSPAIISVCFLLGLLAHLLIASCHKSEEIAPLQNRPPIAEAGPDQTIILPNNSATLDGSRSTDPDNDIGNYQWTKISGPNKYNIINASATGTEVKNLIEGSYRFELLVKDLTGLTSRDTVTILVTSQVIIKSTSFTEEFDTVYKLQTKGWSIKNNSSVDGAWWVQGHVGSDKAGVLYGFPAYSYLTTPDEFVCANVLVSDYYGPYIQPGIGVSSWLITPVLSVKNGDKFSFYTRADAAADYADRLQLFMSASAGNDVGNTFNSVGDFTISLLEINQSLVANGYPKTWTKYEYTFSGISGTTNIRIAFRYFVPTTSRKKEIGIDLFKFEKF